MKVLIEKIDENSTQEINVISKWFDKWYEWPKPYWTEKRINKRLKQLAKSVDNLSSVFVAKINGEIVGTLGIGRYDSTRKSPLYYPWIVNAYVMEEYRKNGIYKILLKSAYEYLTQKGYKKAYIRTDWNGLYEKLGWEYIGNITLDDGVVERLYVYDL